MSYGKVLMLIIGNGFDLACGLPTRYTDFLEFINVIWKVCRVNVPYGAALGWDLNKDFQQILQENCLLKEIQTFIATRFSIDQDSECPREHNDFLNEQEKWKKLIVNNFWLSYLQKEKVGKDWIDFEKEIKKVIMTVDDAITNMEAMGILFPMDKQVPYIEGDEISPLIEKYIGMVPVEKGSGLGERGTGYFDISFAQLKDRLLEDLNRLTVAFERYISEYIEYLHPENSMVPDIRGIVDDIKTAEHSYVLSFNYTHSLQRILKARGIKRSVNFCYIHGESRHEELIDEDTGLVLGIEDYLDENKASSEEGLRFAEFKKYHQRLFKKTDESYMLWHKAFNRMGNVGEDGIGRLHDVDLKIFGHSLGLSDKEVLKSFIIPRHTQTEIYYYNRIVYRKQITNLAGILGKEQMIEMVSGEKARIKFVEQQKG